MKFSWTKAVGYGVLIWGAMAVSLWILGSIQSLSSIWVHSLVAVVGGISAYLFAFDAKAGEGIRAAGYGLSWAIVTLMLDLVVVQRFDAHVFASWPYWVGIALVFIAPWIQTETTGETVVERM